MEIIIAIVVFGFGLWWVFLRTPADTKPVVPYKVETPPAPEPVPVVVEAAPVVAVEGTEVVEVATAPVALAPVETAPAKKTRKPRAPKAPVAEKPAAEKPAAKKAAPVKKAAAIKAAPKKPATPRSKKS